MHPRKNHTCSHLMIALHLYQMFQQLYYCRKRGKAYSLFPPLLNDWRPVWHQSPISSQTHSCNIWIAMETAFILWAPPPAFIQTPWYLPAFIGWKDAPCRSHKEQMIPRRHMMKLHYQSNVWTLGRAPTHRAICQRKTPSPNLLLILITNRILRLSRQRFLCDVGRGCKVVWLRGCSSGATGKLQMSLSHSYSRKWERLLLHSDLFAAGGLIRSEPLKVWAESLHAINHSCPPWLYSMCSGRDSSPSVYSCNTACK